MSGLRILYLGLALVGTYLPLSFGIPWMQGSGGDFPLLYLVWLDTQSARWVDYPAMVTVAALTVWILSEIYARKDYWVLICLPATFLIGVSSGLPLFLFLRSRPVG